MFLLLQSDSPIRCLDRDTAPLLERDRGVRNPVKGQGPRLLSSLLRGLVHVLIQGDKSSLHFPFQDIGLWYLKSFDSHV